MALVELITKDDLEKFKLELFAELKTLLSSGNNGADKKWLRSAEVRKMLGISPGTLQNLRINGTLPYSLVGSIHYYRLEDINKMLEKEKSWR
jgi:hypothetical protein